MHRHGPGHLSNDRKMPPPAGQVRLATARPRGISWGGRVWSTGEELAGHCRRRDGTSALAAGSRLSREQTARPASVRLVGSFDLVRPGGTMGSAPPGAGEHEKEAEASL